MLKSVFALLALFVGSHGLDLELRKVTCDESLPAYISQGDISWECSDGGTRCPMGDTATISGGITYNNLAGYTNYNSSGYATATLNMLTLEYELFELLPFNFCGDWVKNANGYYSNSSCPYDGYYHFDLSYTLPPNPGRTTWFASGWTATSEIVIFNSRTEGSAILTDCLLEFHTYVSQHTVNANGDEWQAVPSAASVTIVLLGIAVLMCVTICCLACRTRKQRVTDRDFGAEEDDGFIKMGDDGLGVTAQESAAVETARKVSRKMRYGTPGEADWS